MKTLMEIVTAELQPREYANDDHLDQFLGQVLIPGHITEFYGEAGAGKSQLCAHLAACSSLKGNVIYMDTEGKVRANRLAEIIQCHPSLCGSQQKILNAFKYFYAKTPSMLEEIVQKLKSDVSLQPIQLIIVDSVAGASRFYFDTFSELKIHLMKLRSHLQDLASELLVPVIVTNQVSAQTSLDPTLHFQEAVADQAAVYTTWGKDIAIRVNIQNRRSEDYQKSQTTKTMFIKKLSLPGFEVKTRHVDFLVMQAGIKHTICDCRDH